MESEEEGSTDEGDAEEGTIRGSSGAAEAGTRCGKCIGAIGVSGIVRKERGSTKDEGEASGGGQE